MSQNYFATKQGKSTLKAICIVASYIVMYGIFALLMGLIENNSIAFIIFIVICMFFTYKSCKGMLVNHLSNLPWPVFLVLIILLSGVIGVFTAPYHIGKWIAEKISKNIPNTPNNSNGGGNSSAPTSVQHSAEYNRIIQNLNQMSEQNLDQIHDTLIKYVNEMPFSVPLPGTNQTLADAQKRHAEFCRKPIPNGPIYGCRTYGEAEEMNKAVVRRLDVIDKNR